MKHLALRAVIGSLMLVKGRKTSLLPRDSLLRRAIVAVFSTDIRRTEDVWLEADWQTHDTEVLRPDESASGLGVMAPESNYQGHRRLQSIPCTAIER